MKQQYIILHKENDLLNSLIGQSFNQKSKFEAEKILNEIHSKAQARSIGKMALCYVLDKNEILGVGGSTLLKDKKTGEIVSNLILNQFGIWLAGMFHRFTGGTTSRVIRDITNTNRTINVYSSIATYNLILAGSLGLQLQVGAGSTAPARTDFNIETPFGTAPESTPKIPISDGAFNSGLGNFKTNISISAGGSGTVNESVVNFSWRDSFGTTRGFVVFRDIISPAVPFVVGQTIALEYTVQL